jgi:hypothetical protein
MARRSFMVGTLALLALAAAAAAGATATPRSPEAGGETTSHPVFTWSKPAGETSAAIFLASSPATTPEGKFYAERVVDSDFFSDDVLTWAPERPLFAGRYWWSVETRDGDFKSYYMRPAPFVVRPAAAIRSLRTHAYGALHSLDLTVTWTANTRSAVVGLKIRRGTSTIGTYSGREDVPFAGDPNQTSLSWRRSSRIRAGTRVTLVVTVRAGSVTRTLTRAFRAP